MSDHNAIVSQLQSLFEGFNAHDLDKVMSHFARDAMFDTAGGSDPHGNRLHGIDEIAKAFKNTFQEMPDCHWDIQFHDAASPSRAVSHWIFTGTGQGGDSVKVEGVDIFHFENGLITHKSVFKKVPS
jgi:hypothetical protein